MKMNLLKMALLAFATFAASVASAQSTYVLYGNVGEGEVKLSTTRDKASDGTMTVSDYSENGQVSRIYSDYNRTRKLVSVLRLVWLGNRPCNT